MEEDKKSNGLIPEESDNEDQSNKLTDEDNKELGEITQILSKWNEAKIESLDEIFPKVYDNLRNLAKKARQTLGLVNSDDTYNTFSLVNQTYLKLRESKAVGFDNRRRFYAFCLLLMKHFLIDYYRKKKAKQNEQPLTDEIISVMEEKSTLAVNDCINLSFLGGYSGVLTKLELRILIENLLIRLEKTHPIEAEVIFLKYVLDLSTKEVAHQLGLKPSDVRDKETTGRALIRRMLTEIDPIVAQASDLTTNSRNSYLTEICGKDKNLLRDLEIILKERMKKAQ